MAPWPSDFFLLKYANINYMKDLVQNFHFWPPKIEQFSVPKIKNKKERKKKKLKWSSSSYMCPVVPFRNKNQNQNFFFSNKNSKKFSRITSIDTTFQDFQNTTSFTLCTNISQCHTSQEVKKITSI